MKEERKLANNQGTGRKKGREEERKGGREEGKKRGREEGGRRK